MHRHSRHVPMLARLGGPKDNEKDIYIYFIFLKLWAIYNSSQVKSSQVTFIYIALLTIQIVTKQLHNIKMGK